MSRSFAAIGLVVSLLIAVTTAVEGEETVTNPDVVMDLKWEIGSWTDVWQIETFDSDIVDNDVSYYVYRWSR
ncbi:MAG: hypothetical protein KAJ57_05660 [Woeseiaceae bacterium]|nr:hypothetical protein [Woeseiaceae bacterium]